MSVTSAVIAAQVASYRRVLVAGSRDTISRVAHARSGEPVPGGAVLSDPQIDRMVDRYAVKVAQQHGSLRYAKAAPGPVRPLDAYARAYDRDLRRSVLRPFLRSIREGLSEAVGAAEAIERLDGVPITTARRSKLVSSQVNAQAKRLSGYHRRKLIQTFRTALGVNIGSVLNDAAIRPLMTAWRQDNISLITTVPERLRAGLRAGINKTFAERPFDQQALSQVVREQGQSAGYNLRRITRDQTNKAIGQLTHARHKQIGIAEYDWLTAGDERVRPSHAELDGTRHSWEDPPSVGHPGEDIQCRCVAIPVITTAAAAIDKPAPKPKPKPASNDFTALSRSKLPTPPAAAVEAAEREANFVGALAENAKAHGLTVSEYRARANTAMTRLFRSKQVNIQVREETLPKILRSGRFKSQFETQSSEGLFSPSIRGKFEREIMGVADDLAASDRPIYGWAGDLRYKELDSTVEAYGKVTVRLKDSVRRRSTASVGDSLNNGLSPSPLNKFDVRSIHAERGGIPDPLKASSLDDIAQSRQYAEVQVHGQVRVSDIDRVLINSDTARQNPELVRSLHKSGIRVDEYDTIWDRYRKFGKPGDPVPRQIKPGKLRAEGGLPD